VHLLLCPPTHSYLNFSPGLDFETQIVASKHNIAEVLRSELAQPRYVPRLVNIGSATDCYQPVERELKLTRSLIEVMQQARHPFSLITKSSGVSATWICWPLWLRSAWRRSTSPSPRSTRYWPAEWSRAPPRPIGACAPSARWPTRACPWV
jgi:hypothetical protein